MGTPEEVKVKRLLSDIKRVLREAGKHTGVERKIQLEVAGDLMRQYQAHIELDFGIYIIRCGWCGRTECSH